MLYVMHILVYIRADVIVSFRTGFDIHQMLRPVKGKAGKRFSTIKKKKREKARAHTHTRTRGKGKKDRRHEKRNVKAYKHIMLISFVLNTTAFCSTHE